MCKKGMYVCVFFLNVLKMCKKIKNEFVFTDTI